MHLLKLQKDLKKKSHITKQCTVPNEIGLFFSKELEIQNPIDYFMKCIEKHFDKNKLKKADIEIEISNFPKLAEVFCW